MTFNSARLLIGLGTKVPRRADTNTAELQYNYKFSSSESIW